MLEEQLMNTLAFLQTNPIVAVIVGMVVLALFYSKPKEMFKLVAFCIFLAVVFYGIILLVETVSTGTSHKDQMIYKSKDVIGE